MGEGRVRVEHRGRYGEGAKGKSLVTLNMAPLLSLHDDT
jgi:hypothetical protein